jgi:hypothetical protein
MVDALFKTIAFGGYGSLLSGLRLGFGGLAVNPAKPPA